MNLSYEGLPVTSLTITARRIGLGSRAFTIETPDRQLARVSSRFFHLGGALATSEGRYTFTPGVSGGVLQNNDHTKTFTTTRSGFGVWSMKTPEQTYQLRRGRGAAPSRLIDDAGHTVAEVTRSGFAGRIRTVTTESVSEPTALLALLTILARRRKVARTTAVVR